MATAVRPGSAPAMLRERMQVIELPGYTTREKRVTATRHLLPLQRALHGLSAEQVRITDAAVEAVIGGYTREAGVWDLAEALGALCAKVVRRRAEWHGQDEDGGNEEEHEGNEEEHGRHDEHGSNDAPYEVTPETVVEMLGAPAYDERQVTVRTRWPGVAVGLCRTAAGGGEVVFVEASTMPGCGALTLTGRLGAAAQESARTALSWLRANAARYGLDPAFDRDADLHLHVQSDAGPSEGTLAGVTMAAHWCRRSPGARYAATWPWPARSASADRCSPSAASRRRCSPPTAAD